MDWGLWEMNYFPVMLFLLGRDRGFGGGAIGDLGAAWGGDSGSARGRDPYWVLYGVGLGYGDCGCSGYDG